MDHQSEIEKLTTELENLKAANSKLQRQLSHIKQELCYRDERLKIINEEFTKSREKWKQQQAAEQALKQPLPSFRPYEPTESAETQTSPSMECRKQPPVASDQSHTYYKSPHKGTIMKEETESVDVPSPPPFPENLFRYRSRGIAQFSIHASDIPPAPPLPRYLFGLVQSSRPHVK